MLFKSSNEWMWEETKEKDCSRESLRYYEKKLKESRHRKESRNEKVGENAKMSVCFRKEMENERKQKNGTRRENENAHRRA